MIKSKTFQWIVSDKLGKQGYRIPNILVGFGSIPRDDGGYLQYNIAATSPSQIDASAGIKIIT